MDNQNTPNENFSYIPTEPEQNIDTVDIYFTPESAQTFLRWAKFLAIAGIIIFGFQCLSILGIPLGIIGIIAAVHLLNLCTDIKSQIQTNNLIFAESAGEHMYKAVKQMFIMVIIQIALTALSLVLFIAFLPLIIEFIISIIKESGIPDTGIELTLQALRILL